MWRGMNDPTPTLEAAALALRSADWSALGVAADRLSRRRALTAPAGALASAAHAGDAAAAVAALLDLAAAADRGGRIAA